jgi:hypothetical protein
MVLRDGWHKEKEPKPAVPLYMYSAKKDEETSF